VRKNIFFLFMFIIFTVIVATQASAQNDSGLDPKYWEKNGAIPKEYGRLVQVRDKWMFFEADDGTIRIVEFSIWDKTTHYISKVQNNVIKRK